MKCSFCGRKSEWQAESSRGTVHLCSSCYNELKSEYAALKVQMENHRIIDGIGRMGRAATVLAGEIDR